MIGSILAVFLGLAAGPEQADGAWYTQGTFEPVRRVAIQVRNPLDVARTNSPVIIQRSDLGPLQDIHELQMTLVDPKGVPNAEPSARQRALEGAHGQLAETNGHAFPYQFDDLDQDGLWDELFFMADFAPGETKTVYVYLGTQERGWAAHRTHAATGSYMRHTVPFWESETFGWKLWYPTDIDVYAKRTPQLMSQRLYMENLDGYAVSLIDPGLGSDIMRVASSFGGGGIGLIEDPAHPGVISRPRFGPGSEGNFNGGPVSSPRYAFTVLANGPVRSMVRIRTMNWNTPHGSYELDQIYSSYAGQDYSTARVAFRQIDPVGPAPRFVVGIRKHLNEDTYVQEGGLVISAAPEVIRNPDDLEQVQPDMTVAYAGTALVVPDRLSPTYAFAPQDEGNHVMSMPMTADGRFDYLLAAGWSEGPNRRTASAFADYVRTVAREYNAPVVLVSINSETRPSETP
ncbi:DUF4861 family protein [Brevundimonas subvibrioides]|uniref:DUF4861 family protein n=1 Tax=Brevundimonas subvibrioides TaxID=74313 RepID=UPI0022B59186|nr:DUF4861 family protein [Brevundimonas subvibrioides]